MSFFKMPYNGLGLCEEADLEAQMFVLAQMFIRIPKVQFSTEPAFLQNPCYALVPFFGLFISFLFVVSWCVGLVALLDFFVWLCALAKMQMCYQKHWLFIAVRLLFVYNVCLDKCVFQSRLPSKIVNAFNCENLVWVGLVELFCKIVFQYF